MDRFHLYNDLYEVLKTNERFCTDDGKLNKAVIEQAATSLDGELLSMLLSTENLKKHFFKEVNEMMVFDKVDFLKFIINKNLLHDDYSFYKERIGLTNEHGQYIADSQEVVLSWKYKDCMLEGGQTKEDQKHDEVFWNTILASDEINRLTEGKAFAGFKRYDKDGEHEVEHLMPNDNLIIKGNNLLALYSLKDRFPKGVKLIYIDPPYNTGDDSFGYNDNFKHSTWLTFMKNRLEIAHQLLRNDGAIFVHIDHHELFYIGALLDSIFGKENKVQVIAVKTATPAGFKTVNPGPIDVTEYILFYTKSKPSFKFKKSYVPVDYNVNYNLVVDMNGTPKDWKFIPIKDAVLKSAGFNTEKEAKDKYGKLWTTLNKQMIAQFAYDNAENVVSVRDPHKPTETVKELMRKSKTVDYVIEQVKEDGSRSYFYKGGALAFYSNKMQLIDGEKCVTELLTDFWNHISWAGIANEGGVKLKNGKKPEKLIKQILELTTEEGDVVMDFHLGSGTTTAVAHKMKRQYIGIEQLNYGNNDSVVRMCNVVKGDQTGISKAVNWKGGGSFVYCELAKANEIYREEIFNAKEEAELNTIWESMQATNFLSYKIDPTKIDVTSADYTKLTLEEKKRFLMECLDMNQLYIPFADMDNPDYEISAKDKELTREFYGVNGNE